MTFPANDFFSTDGQDLCSNLNFGVRIVFEIANPVRAGNYPRCNQVCIAVGQVDHGGGVFLPGFASGGGKQQDRQAIHPVAPLPVRVTVDSGMDLAEKSENKFGRSHWMNNGRHRILVEAVLLER